MEKLWIILQVLIVTLLVTCIVMIEQLQTRLDEYIAMNNQQIDDISCSGTIPLDDVPEPYIEPLVLNPKALPQAETIRGEVDLVLAQFIMNEDVIHFDSLSDLIMETLYVETKNGEFGLGSKNGQGMGQITIPTALYTLKTLQKKDEYAYNRLISFSSMEYPENLDSIKRGTEIYKEFVDELRHNLTFHVALMYHVYLQKDKKLLKHISTVANRASVWKTYYNTKAGSGTVEGYVKKTKELYD